MLCPRDETDLKTILAGGHTLQRCAVCGGVWISRKTLDRLAHLNAKMPPKAPQEPPPGSTYPETTCLVHKHEPMDQIFIEDVEIDLCREGDGIWLDGGECQRIIDRRGRYCKREDSTLDADGVAVEVAAGAAAGAVLAPVTAAADAAAAPGPATQSSAVGDAAGNVAGEVVGELATEGAMQAVGGAGDLTGAATDAASGAAEAAGAAAEAAGTVASGAAESVAEIGGAILEGVGELAVGILEGIAGGLG
jgi:Zn-finger nucleic acid-binding protein